MLKRLFASVFGTTDQEPNSSLSEKPRKRDRKIKTKTLLDEISDIEEEKEDDSSKVCNSIVESMCSIDGIQCCICMDFIISCRTAVCGHSFCEECINESLLRKRECPQCRKDIRKLILQKSELIDNAVKLMVESKKEKGLIEDAKRWEERVGNHQKWIEKHRVSGVKTGQKLDVLDTEHIWCKAIVELKIQAQNREPLLLMHYDGWSRKYDEYLNQSSRRLAPLGVYTNRTDIPCYKMCSNQPVNYAHVMENARQYRQIIAELEAAQNPAEPNVVAEEDDDEDDEDSSNLQSVHQDDPAVGPVAPNQPEDAQPDVQQFLR